MVFMNIESEEGEILIRSYNRDSTSEKYLCVDVASGGIDFFEPNTYDPTYFVLNIPACQVKESSFEIVEMQKQRKVLYKNQESLTNRSNKLKGMFVRPPSKNNNCD